MTTPRIDHTRRNNSLVNVAVMSIVIFFDFSLHQKQKGTAPYNTRIKLFSTVRSKISTFRADAADIMYSVRTLKHLTMYKSPKRLRLVRAAAPDFTFLKNFFLFAHFECQCQLVKIKI